MLSQPKRMTLQVRLVPRAVLFHFFAWFECSVSLVPGQLSPSLWTDIPWSISAADPAIRDTHGESGHVRSPACGCEWR
jgi:hypothetical protein